MEFTGLEIYKLLPKTNCRDCNFPSCLSFAMKVAGKKASYELCPHLSSQAKLAFQESAKPKIKPIKIYKGNRSLVIGDEKVLFRHEESFYHPAALAVKVPGGIDIEDFKKRLNFIKNFSLERAGEKFSLDIIALEDSENSIEFASVILKETDFSVIVLRSSMENLKKYVDLNKDRRLIFAGINLSNYCKYIDLIKDKEVILALEEEEEKIETLVKNLECNGFENIILSCLPSHSLRQKLKFLCGLRDGAVNRRIPWQGYPSFMEVNFTGISAAAIAGIFLIRYASLIILNDLSVEVLLSLLTLRQNIFSDPRRPIQVEPKLYPFGKVSPDSPIIVTTNFSLTYHLVSSEIESSLIPCYLLIIDTEGTSVLTAFASDKFSSEAIIKGADGFKVKNTVNHKTLIIPGYVSILKEDIESESDYKVIAGPKEASAISRFLKELRSKQIGVK